MKTSEKLISIYSTNGGEHAILRLQKGLVIKEGAEGHFTIRIGENK